MELFRDVNIDWLGKKWYFLGFSLIFSVAGVLSMLFWHHIPLGIDFKGGTQITVPFDATPNVDHVRAALSQGGVKDFTTQQEGGAGGNTNDVIISLPETSASDTNHDAGRIAVENALNTYYKESGYKSPSVQIVGPTAGKQLQRQAALATAYSLAGMLIYLWIRFELDLWRRGGGGSVPRHTDYGGRVQPDQPGDLADGDCGDPDPDRLLDERHHRGV